VSVQPWQVAVKLKVVAAAGAVGNPEERLDTWLVSHVGETPLGAGGGAVSPSAMVTPSASASAANGPLGSERVDSFVFGVAVATMLPAAVRRRHAVVAHQWMAWRRDKSSQTRQELRRLHEPHPVGVFDTVAGFTIRPQIRRPRPARGGEIPIDSMETRY